MSKPNGNNNGNGGNDNTQDIMSKHNNMEAEKIEALKEELAKAKEEIEKLKKASSELPKFAWSGYSVSGYLPVGGEWKLTENQIKDIIMRITRKWIDDAKSVSLMVDHRTGALYAYVTIPANSKHITSHKLNSNDSAIKRPMKEFSSQLKEYMDKFCEKPFRRLLPGERNNSMYGIQVEIPRFMRIEFDDNGYEYGKKFGDKYKKRTRIKLYPNFLRPKDGMNGNYGSFNFMRVIKTVESEINRDDWRPKRSYNVR